MKKLFGALLALVSSVAFGTTLVPVQLLNPTGSSSGQAIISTGSSNAPGWGNVSASGLAAQAANTVLANVTASSASPTAFAMPSCSTSASALTYTTSTGFTCNTAVNAATLGGATFASPGAIGSTTAGTGAFTTLGASGNDALLYQTTNAQSFTSGVGATVTTWTKLFDRVNANFNASTGVFTAPATGYYHVSAGVDFSANTGAVGTVGQLTIVANGTAAAACIFIRQTATSTSMPCTVSVDINLTSGQQVAVQGLQTTGGAVTLNGQANANFISIHRIP